MDKRNVKARYNVYPLQWTQIKFKNRVKSGGGSLQKRRYNLRYQVSIPTENLKNRSQTGKYGGSEDGGDIFRLCGKGLHSRFWDGSSERIESEILFGTAQKSKKKE
jgi:hypothetical protein